jgi:hypothetical protein
VLDLSKVLGPVNASKMVIFFSLLFFYFHVTYFFCRTKS